jgi:putative FmdB family regulatory protein
VPLYEYECTKCGRRFEVIQKFSDPIRKTCEVCKGPLKKLISAPAIQFKGSGWYVTDYGRGGSGGKKSESKEASKEPAAKESSSSKDSTSKESSAPSGKKADPASSSPRKKRG